MTSWRVRDAKARFGEFLDASINKGPQMVTRRGVKTAVLVSIVLPKRGTLRSRPIVEFE